MHIRKYFLVLSFIIISLLIIGCKSSTRNGWVGTPTNCGDNLLEKDSKFSRIDGRDIKLNQIPAVELKFDLNGPQIKKITDVKVKIDMVCKFSLSIFTLTEFNEWKPVPDFYFQCQEWTKDRKVAEIEPILNDNIAYVLITPGTGDSEADIDYATLEVSFENNSSEGGDKPIIVSKSLKPVSVLCGIKTRDTVPKNKN